MRCSEGRPRADLEHWRRRRRLHVRRSVPSMRQHLFSRSPLQFPLLSSSLQIQKSQPFIRDQGRMHLVRRRSWFFSAASMIAALAIQFWFGAETVRAGCGEYGPMTGHSSTGKPSTPQSKRPDSHRPACDECPNGRNNERPTPCNGPGCSGDPISPPVSGSGNIPRANDTWACLSIPLPPNSRSPAGLGIESQPDLLPRFRDSIFHPPRLS